MRLIFSLLTIVAAAAFTAGCNKAETPSQQPDKVKVKATAAAQDMKEYTFAQKAEFTVRMESELAAINQDLDLLAAIIEKSSDAVKAEAKPKLELLRTQAAKLDTQLDEVRNATEST
jgi:hypothetical protein